MVSARMQDVKAVMIPGKIVQDTLAVLQVYGKRRLEGLVLWVGNIENEVARVLKAIAPEQNPIRSEEGVGYFVTGDTLFLLNRFLAESGLRLLAQVHSHPTEAYHSDTDDRYSIVTAEGGLSLVVPNFGIAPEDPGAWAVYQLRQGVWTDLDRAEVEQLLKVSNE
jgi:hypothetical protein